MLQVRSTHNFHATEVGLRKATEQAGGSVLAITSMGVLLHTERAPGTDALALTLCFEDLYAPLLAADVRFAAFLPVRVAVCENAGNTSLESISPRECCRVLHRPDLEPLAMRLEERLRAVMERAALSAASVSEPHKSTEEQINMRAAAAACRLPRDEDRGPGGHRSAGYPGRVGGAIAVNHADDAGQAATQAHAGPAPSTSSQRRAAARCGCRWSKSPARSCWRSPKSCPGW
jgi:uncharacterized protein (DUF302 family)